MFRLNRVLADGFDDGVDEGGVVFESGGQVFGVQAYGHVVTALGRVPQVLHLSAQSRLLPLELLYDLL